MHIQQRNGPWFLLIPPLINLSFVGRRFRIAIQGINKCLGNKKWKPNYHMPCNLLILWSDYIPNSGNSNLPPFSSELPSTTKASSLGLSIFLQLQLVLYFSYTWLKEERLSKYSWIQAIQRDLWPVKIVLMNWIIQALFQLLRAFIPRRPSTLEEQILFQLTLATLVKSYLPFQKKKKREHIWLIRLRIPFGRMKCLHQKFRIWKITDWINCILLAKLNCFAAYLVILDLILSNNGKKKSFSDSFRVTRGIPR